MQKIGEITEKERIMLKKLESECLWGTDFQEKREKSEEKLGSDQFF